MRKNPLTGRPVRKPAAKPIELDAASKLAKSARQLSANDVALAVGVNALAKSASAHLSRHAQELADLRKAHNESIATLIAAINLLQKRCERIEQRLGEQISLELNVHNEGSGRRRITTRRNDAGDLVGTIDED